MGVKGQALYKGFIWVQEYTDFTFISGSVTHCESWENLYQSRILDVYYVFVIVKAVTDFPADCIVIPAVMRPVFPSP